MAGRADSRGAAAPLGPHRQRHTPEALEYTRVASRVCHTTQAKRSARNQQRRAARGQWRPLGDGYIAVARPATPAVANQTEP